jgi:ATP-dependent Zn protease
MNTKDDRLGAAYHEAGHAVVAWSLGVPVGIVAIREDDPTAGTTQIGSTEHLPIIDRLAVCLAGVEAQDLFRCSAHEHAGLSDYAKVLAIVEHLSDEESDQLRNAGHKRARELILVNRARVELLAERLAEHGRVDFDGLIRLMRD